MYCANNKARVSALGIMLRCLPFHSYPELTFIIKCRLRGSDGYDLRVSALQSEFNAVENDGRFRCQGQHLAVFNTGKD